MDEIARIRDQIARTALEGDAWHGPPLMAVLAGLDADTASVRPIANAHTPWEILLHITAWAEVVLARLNGEAPELSDAEDWPTPAGGADVWQADVDRLKHVHRDLLDALTQLDASRLDEPILPGYSSTYVTLHGLVQHNLYHGGQIAILAKAAPGTG
jgi:uncharacterized damage-inducible protein DinB